jgi:Uma2 family endonuclease
MIGVSLLEFGDRTKSGYGLFGTVAYLVDLPNRSAFCPDAAFYTGPALTMKFPEGAPIFAVEVRNPWDYGDDYDAELRQKIADYFAAGTLVVWDVDLLGEDIVRVYRATDPMHPIAYRKGQTADAEPAVPGWSMPVDDIFAP